MEGMEKLQARPVAQEPRVARFAARHESVTASEMISKQEEKKGVMVRMGWTRGAGAAALSCPGLPRSFLAPSLRQALSASSRSSCHRVRASVAEPGFLPSTPAPPPLLHVESQTSRIVPARSRSQVARGHAPIPG